MISHTISPELIHIHNIVNLDRISHQFPGITWRMCSNWICPWISHWNWRVFYPMFIINSALRANNDTPHLRLTSIWGIYPLVNRHSYGKWPIETDGLPSLHILNMGGFSIAMLVITKGYAILNHTSPIRLPWTGTLAPHPLPAASH